MKSSMSPPSASGALAGVSRDDDDYAGAGPVRTVVAAPARWGALPAVVLLPTLLLVFMGGLMSFELLQGMWGYHQPGKPSSLILREMAGMLDLKVND